MKTRLTSVTYLGSTSMDPRFSNAMIPWIFKEIRASGINDKLSIVIEDGCLKAYNGNFEPVLVHRLIDILRTSQVPGTPEELFYLHFNENQGLLQCFMFRANSIEEVTDLFTQMREPSASPTPRGSISSQGNGSVTKNIGFQSSNSAEHLPWNHQQAMSLPKNCNINLSSETPLVRSTSNASALTSLCAGLSPSESHFFEVLYIGKVRISQRKVPESLIDDALLKFAQHEAEKARINEIRRNSLLSSTGTIYSVDSSDTINEKLKAEENTETNKTALTNTSTTPLEPDKSINKTTDDIKDKNTRPNKENDQDFDKEFDMFTQERVEKTPVIKKPSIIPLEPTVLVLNLPNKNLEPLHEAEEKSEDLNKTISDAASSVTQFCVTDIINKKIETTELKTNNPFLDDVKTDDKTKQSVDTKKSVDTIKSDSPEALAKQDSDASSINFDEIKRKPLMVRSNTGLTSRNGTSMPENKPFLRDRSASSGTISIKTPIAQLIGEQNRTMLFQVARSELRLISPDRKQILLHRGFKDVASIVLGRVSKEHFGFVCRENINDSYACYVFKCESDEIAMELVKAIKQAFTAHAELMKKTREKSPNMSCEHCPMLWYHRLCHDMEGMNDRKTHAFILRRIEQLPNDEQEKIITKYQGGSSHMYETSEHNAFLMMLLRAHCEAKQQRHVHDTAENRSEFLNQYLGGSTIFMKAKRSLSSGFDNLLKRKASKDDLSTTPVHVKKESSPLPSTPVSETPSESGNFLAVDATRSKSLSPVNIVEIPPSPSNTSLNPLPTTAEEEEGAVQEHSSNSPMMDIFLKVGDSRPPPPAQIQEATWRQAIYQTVVAPTDAQGDEISAKALLNFQRPAQDGRRTKDQLRQLWKMAIDQTILLVRMERENVKLQQSEESSAMRRIKLEYAELGACEAGVSLMWDSLLNNRGSNNRICKVDHHMLTQAVRQGVPRMLRGGIWYFLAEQACLRSAPPDSKQFPLYNTPYATLLAGLTKHQHAILIDLGRTFPQHSYFASALGPGQLALYNLLKAYSLIDPEVGYCQGLSFVAGVLLLHLEEAEAFILLRHLMFRRGLRKQYLPDMSALQVQLYQLSRLIKQHEPELHSKLEQLDVSPALYAAPWMLTLFTSQFPLGFVVRLYDLIFLDSFEIVFAVSLALLSVHRDGLMMCESCEEAAEYLKVKLPDIDKGMYEKVMKKVHTLDISRQLSEYAVEYSVLREEMPRVASLTESNRKLSNDNRRMEEELDSAMESLTNYQVTQAKYESQVKSLEQQLTLLSRYMNAYHKQEMPLEVKKIVQNYSKKPSFGSKIFASKFNNDEDEDSKKSLKTGMSTPNLFSKISKEDLLNLANREKSRISPENDRKHFLMKKSQSVHSGLIANNIKQYPLKVLEEKSEPEGNKRSESFRNSNNNIKESLKELSKKSSGYFATTHELIRQERFFERQLKQDFDENLKKLDAKLTPESYMDDLSIFQSRKSMSLNLQSQKIREESIQDSGFVTPMSPEDKKDDTASIISHPLSDCDVDIKFDGHSTKLKQIRSVKN